MKKTLSQLSILTILLLLLNGCSKNEENIEPIKNEKKNVTVDINDISNISISNGRTEISLKSKNTYIDNNNLLYAWDNKTDKPVYYSVPSQENVILNSEETGYFMVLNTLPHINLSEKENVNKFKKYLNSLDVFSSFVKIINNQISKNGHLVLNDLTEPLKKITNRIYTDLQKSKISARKIITEEKEINGIRFIPKSQKYFPKSSDNVEYWLYTYDVFNSHGIYLGLDVGDENGNLSTYNGKSQIKFLDPISISDKTFWFFDTDQWSYFLNPFGSGFNKFGTQKNENLSFKFNEKYNDLYILGMKDKRVAIYNASYFVVNNVCELLGADPDAFLPFILDLMGNDQILNLMGNYLEDGTIERVELTAFAEQIFESLKSHILENLTESFIKKAFAKEQISRKLLEQSFKSFDLTFQALDIVNMMFSAYTVENMKYDNLFKSDIPTDGLVAYYPFNGNANDESGNGNNGTVNGATLTADRHGNANNAYSFDGVDDFIDFGDIELPHNNFTYSIWVKDLSNQTGSAEEIIGKHSTKTDVEVLLRTEEDNKIDFEVTLDDNFYDLTSTTFENDQTGIKELPLNQYTHLLVTYNGNVIKLYKNGLIIGQRNANGTAYNNSYNLYIGRSSATDPSYGNFELDDFRIYNRALTNSEIQALYNE